MNNGRQTLRAISAFLSKEGSMPAIRTLMGVALGAAIGSGIVVSPILVAGMALGFVGITAFAHRSIELGRREELLDTYRTEISNMLGKPQKELKVDDLERAAKSPNNPKGSTAIRMALDESVKTRNFYIVSQLVTAAIMATTLKLINMNVEGVPPFALAGASGFVYNLLFRNVENVYSFATNAKGQRGITREISEINNQISLGTGVASTRVLDILAKTDPVLQEAIEEKFHQPYENLSIAEKRDAVKLLDEKAQITELTKDINTGRVLPTELAFIAFGESSGTPKRDIEVEVHVVEGQGDTKSWTAHIATPEGSHARQVEIETEQVVDGVPTLH